MSTDPRLFSAESLAAARAMCGSDAPYPMMGRRGVEALLDHIDAVTAQRDAALEVADYAEHQSWRCDHPPHFYMAGKGSVPDGDCPCGLLGDLARLEAVVPGRIAPNVAPHDPDYR